MNDAQYVATEPAQMTGAEAAALIKSKQLSCEELARSCLARIAARDAAVKAWLVAEQYARSAAPPEFSSIGKHGEGSRWRERRR